MYSHKDEVNRYRQDDPYQQYYQQRDQYKAAPSDRERSRYKPYDESNRRGYTSAYYEEVPQHNRYGRSRGANNRNEDRRYNADRGRPKYNDARQGSRASFRQDNQEQQKYDYEGQDTGTCSNGDLFNPEPKEVNAFSENEWKVAAVVHDDEADVKPIKKTETVPTDKGGDDGPVEGGNTKTEID